MLHPLRQLVLKVKIDGDKSKKLKDVLDIWKPFKNKIELLKKSSQEIKKDKEVMMEKIENLLIISDSVVKKMVNENLPGNYIDLSGRQRMLSQKMGLYLVRYLKTGSEKEYFKFNNAKNLYDKTITNFISDEMIKKRSALFSLIKENFSYWQDFTKYIKNLILKLLVSKDS